MQSKLTRYMEGLMEAAWLAAVIIVPVFFNVYSSRIFEPDKISLLRSLALVILGAWMVKSVDQGRLDWGRARVEGQPLWKSLLRIPMVPAVIALAASYLIATVFSISPRISLLGSYQRLQGTYTTFSYLIIFAAIASQMRRREQIERLVSAVILSSLAVSLYAVLQKYQLDPIPWGGDTTKRVAANLGNAIFISAYLILTFPLTLGRIVDAFSNILDLNVNRLAPQIARGVVYVFTAALQLIAIYFSLSRGPILGLLAGTFFMFVLLSLYWGKRWLTFTTVGMAAALGVFLIVLSIPGGPLNSLRSNENIGRLGNVFETDSGTGRVRVLIWQGASRLTWFHEPLEFPNGEKDSFNWMRPIIGYGPETMYVAFNPFYPPELGSIESRNATPDRSHNETWDALAITGWLGLATEQMVFLSFFFFGLKWLGMIGSSRQSKLFFSLTLGGGLVSTLLFAWAVDIGFIGVGLPFGILLGLLAYLTLIALFSKYEIPQSPGEKARALTLMMFVGAVIAHYVEIHFGIAIAATRLYFWVFYGVLLSAGYWMTLEGSFGTQAASQVEDAAIPAAPARAGKRRIQKRTKSNRAAAVSPETRRFAWVSGLTGGILLSTLTYNYITNSGDVSEFGAIIANSLTVLPGRPGASYGILSIFLLIWIAIIVIAGSEWARNQTNGSRYVVVSTAAISAGTWLLFTLMHTSGLVIVIQSAVPQASDTGVYDRIFRQVLALESMLTRYTFFLLVLIFTAAIPIALGGKTASQRPALSGKNTITLSGVFIILFYLIIGSNLRPVQADIAFKVGDSLSRSNTAESWQAALNLFKHANSLAPAQDHYYLYLGRGYLELTRNVQQTAPDQAQNLLLEAESDLKRAQGFNPLNTDHTANLARLYRFWSDIPGVSTSILLAEAEKYYQRALVLSPYNSGIRNELATLYLQNYGDSERGLETLKQSIEIDPFNDSTYATIGDYYSRLAAGNSDEAVIRTNIEQAADYYDIAIEKARGSTGRYLYATALASLYAYGDDIESARDYYLLALDNASANNRWQTEEALGKIHVQLEDYAQALDYAQDAYQHAPEASRASIQQLIDYIQASQETP